MKPVCLLFFLELLGTCFLVLLSAKAKRSSQQRDELAIGSGRLILPRLSNKSFRFELSAIGGLVNQPLQSSYADDQLHSICHPKQNPLACQDDEFYPCKANDIVVIRRGECTFDHKVEKLDSIGAYAMILINSDDSALRMGSMDYVNSAMIAVSITKSDGHGLLELIESTSSSHVNSMNDPIKGVLATSTSVLHQCFKTISILITTNIPFAASQVFMHCSPTGHDSFETSVSRLEDISLNSTTVALRDVDKFYYWWNVSKAFDARWEFVQRLRVDCLVQAALLLKQETPSGKQNEEHGFTSIPQLSREIEEMWLTLGNELTDMGYFDVGRAIFSRLAQQDSLNVRAKYGLALVDVLRANFLSAIKSYHEMFSVSSKLLYDIGETHKTTALWLAHDTLRKLGAYKFSTKEYNCLSFESENLIFSTSEQANSQLKTRNPTLKCCANGFLFYSPFVEQVYHSHSRLGVFLDEVGAFEESITHFEKAFEICGEQSGLKLRQVLAVPTVLSSSKHGEEVISTIETRLEVFIGKQSSHPSTQDSIGTAYNTKEARQFPEKSSFLDWTITPPTMLLGYQGRDVCHLQEKIASLKQSILASRYQPVLDSRVYSAPRKQTSKLRVGFISSWFRHHSVGKLIKGVVEHLDRAKFTLILFKCTHFFSSTIEADEYSKFFRENSDAFIELSDSLQDAKSQVLNETLDILIYPELGMDEWTMTLAQDRFAPVQMVFWGHPITTGILPSIDYFVASEYYMTATQDDSSSSRHLYNGVRYSEQVVLLDGLNVFLQKPVFRSDPLQPSAFNLPESSTFYACLQSLMKLHPSFDVVLRRILEKDDTAIILLLYSKQQVIWKEKVLHRFRESIPRNHHRIIFLHKMTYDMYMNVLTASKVILDPFPFGGGVSTLDALRVGTPVITLPSRQTVVHLAAGFYKHMEIDFCTAKSVDEYVNTAVQTATDPQLRERRKQDILSRIDKLYKHYDSIKEWQIFLQNAHLQVDLSSEQDEK